MVEPEPPSSERALASLQAQYPMLSMIFVIREVLQLKRLGWHIDVASINDPDRALDRLTEVERAEAERTYYVKRHGVRGALVAHAAALRRRPAGWWRGWRAVLRHGGADLRALALHAMYLTEALMVGAWMRRQGQYHLHVHLGSQPATVGLYVKLVFGVGLSITVHGPDEFDDAKRQLLGEKVVAADFVCCISDYARSQLMRLSPPAHWHKLVVIRLGIDPERFAARALPSRRAPDAPFEVLCIGRLTPAKGQHLLLDAVAALHARRRAVRVRIVGAGVDDASLRRHSSALALGDAAVFEGAVDQDRILGFYAAADCFCLPSFAEGIPVVLMEAMAVGLPCVTTQVHGIPELIRDGVDGLLVAPSNVPALVAALSRLMDDPALAERLARAGRERVCAEYDLARNVDALSRLFDERVAPPS
jgi:colanic acid/amylovoran biosynthesis glycosyltransferase